MDDIDIEQSTFPATRSAQEINPCSTIFESPKRNGRGYGSGQTTELSSQITNVSFQFRPGFLSLLNLFTNPKTIHHTLNHW